MRGRRRVPGGEEREGMEVGVFYCDKEGGDLCWEGERGVSVEDFAKGGMRWPWIGYHERGVGGHLR